MKYRYYIDFFIQYIILFITYPYISDAFNAQRGYEATGGEMMLWLVPIMIILVRYGRAIDKRWNR